MILVPINNRSTFSDNIKSNPVCSITTRQTMNIKLLIIATMWKLLLDCKQVTASTATVSTCGCNIPNIELEYYWLDYNGGPMPKNALVVDPSPPNGPTYVGKFYKKNWELLPGTIRTTKPYATSTAYGQMVYHNNHIMVLCSQFPENFKWVPCDINDKSCELIDNKVPAGTELGRNLHVALHYINDVPIIGKIINKGLAIPYEGERKGIDYNYSVLTYQKPQISSGCQPTTTIRPKPKTTFCPIPVYCSPNNRP